MADRPFIKPNLIAPLVNATSMAGDITSPATNIQQLPAFSYDLTWTGTPTGTFAVQLSNTYAQDPEGNVLVAGSWNTIPSANFTGTYPAPAGSSGNGGLDVVGTGFTWCRLVYTRVSGTGNLTVVPSAKVL